MKLGLPDFSKALDAGLPKTVEALLRAGQFNRVANLVAASEPIAAFALRKMREIVGDPLLVARGGGVELTRRARKLAAPFRDLLEQIGEVLSGRDVFDPALCEEAFAVAATDYASFVLGPSLVRAFVEAAPRATLALEPFDPGGAGKALAGGALDLVIAGAVRGAQLHTETLFAERFACIAAKGHPRVTRKLTAAAWAAEGHVVVRASAAAAKADPALADTERKRRTAVAVPHFLLVAPIVAQSALIATLPERVAERFAARHPLVVHRSPVRPTGFSLVMTWHTRSGEDPARAWLRGLVAQAAAAV